MAMFSNGLFAPCPHAHNLEKFDSIHSYWKDSKVLFKYRNTDVCNDICRNCSYKDYCSPCLAFPVYNDCLSNFIESDEVYERV